MAQTFKFVAIAALILCIGLVSSRPVEETKVEEANILTQADEGKRIEKRSSATYLGDLTAEQAGILNDDQGMELCNTDTIAIPVAH